MMNNIVALCIVFLLVAATKCFSASPTCGFFLIGGSPPPSVGETCTDAETRGSSSTSVAGIIRTAEVLATCTQTLTHLGYDRPATNNVGSIAIGLYASSTPTVSGGSPVGSVLTYILPTGTLTPQDPQYAYYPVSSGYSVESGTYYHVAFWVSETSSRIFTASAGGGTRCQISSPGDADFQNSVWPDGSGFSSCNADVYNLAFSGELSPP